MAETLKVLAQIIPTAGLLTDGYTVPAAGRAVVSSIAVCNQDVLATTFRISVAVAGASDNTKQYIYRDPSIQANATLMATVGMTLGPGDVVRVYSANGLVSFNFFGSEIS